MKPLSSVEGRRALEVVVCLEDSILDVIHLRTPGHVRAGHDPGCQVVLPAEALGGQGSMVLASLDATGQAYAARALDASGVMRPIEAQENISLESAKLRVFVRTVPDTQTATRGGWGIDNHTLRVVGASLAGHLLFVWLLLAIPPDARAVNGMDFYRQNRFVKVTAIPNEAEKLEQQKATGTGPQGADEGAQAAAHTGASGKMGKPEITTKGMTAYRGDKPVDKPGPANLRDWVSTRGPLGVIRATDWSPITGTDEQWGSKDKWAYGGDLGAPAGDGGGFGGAGYIGNGPGGCPPGTRHCNGDSIGSGRWNTIGNGPGDGYTGTGPGAHLGPRGHNPGVPPKIGQPVVGPDGLDKAIIKRYIRNRIEAIGYCYEKQLTVNGSIGGTITVEFVIAPSGAVISARGDGSVGSRDVDSCVLEQVRGIQFPKNDGMTNVKYPFTFHAAGQ